jgi:heterodisulfide reductase subunit B
MIVMPCQLCQTNVKIYQSEINKKQDTKFAIPMVYYSQLMSLAYGGCAKEVVLDGPVIQPKKLKDIAGK